MPYFARAFKMLAACILLWSCATQEGLIDRPGWAENPSSWEYAGLTVAAYGKAEYSLSPAENLRQAEEDAMRSARQVIARQIAQAYLKASKDSISEDAATRKVESELGNFIERQSRYDEQRRVYFMQIFVPASRVEEIVRRAFNRNLKLQSNGELG